MSEATRQKVDMSSTEFEEGVDAGLNSAEHTRNWQAGHELGQELKEASEKDAQMCEGPSNESSISFANENIPGNTKGNLQDEKDGTEE